MSVENCGHPLKSLYYHGYVSGGLGEYRCNTCGKILVFPSLSPRAFDTIRVEAAKADTKETPARHKHRGSPAFDRGETCLDCGMDMNDPVHTQETVT